MKNNNILYTFKTNIVSLEILFVFLYILPYELLNT